MRAQIPSTQALTAFEAVARCLNITHAATELFRTPGAVSKQVQSLEDTLGIALFIRGQHGLLLTELGQSYLASIKPALATLAEVGAKVAARQLHQDQLRVRVPPAFAERWLLPRITGFTRANPDLRVQIDASGMRDTHLLEVYDAYVRFGPGFWAGCVSDYLCGKHLVIVASPELLRREPPIACPHDLLQFTLYEHSWNPQGWIHVLGAMGVSGGSAPEIVQWDFNSVIIRGASLGLGLALVAKCFVMEELERGELVQVLDYCQVIPYGNYLVIPEGRRDDTSLLRFRDWLRTERDRAGGL